MEGPADNRPPGSPRVGLNPVLLVRVLEQVRLGSLVGMLLRGRLVGLGALGVMGGGLVLAGGNVLRRLLVVFGGILARTRGLVVLFLSYD